MHLRCIVMKSSINLSNEVKRVFWNYNKREKRFQNKSKNHLVSYDSCVGVYLSSNETVEALYEKRQLHTALYKALKELSAEELQIINECFFFVGIKRQPYKTLAQIHGISRQAYCKRLDKILAKLRVIIQYYLDDE